MQALSENHVPKMKEKFEQRCYRHLEKSIGGHERNQIFGVNSLFCMFYACECHLSNCDCREVDVVYCCEYVFRHDGDFVLRVEPCLFCICYIERS